MHIFITATAKIADNYLIGRHFLGSLHSVGNAVRGFERRDDAFDRTKILEGLQRFGISSVAKINAPFFLIIGMLRTYCCVVETSRDGMCEVNLTFWALQDPSLGSLEDAELSAFEASGMMATLDLAPAGFDAAKLNFKVF